MNDKAHVYLNIFNPHNINLLNSSLSKFGMSIVFTLTMNDDQFMAYYFSLLKKKGINVAQSANKVHSCLWWKFNCWQHSSKVVFTVHTWGIQLESLSSGCFCLSGSSTVDIENVTAVIAENECSTVGEFAERLAITKLTVFDNPVLDKFSLTSLCTHSSELG